MTKYLVKFYSDWADEFDCNGFHVMTDGALKELVDIINSYKNITYYFGTNEGWEYYPSKDFIKKYKISEISQEDADTIQLLFGDKPYGIFPMYFDCEE